MTYSHIFCLSPGAATRVLARIPAGVSRESGDGNERTVAERSAGPTSQCQGRGRSAASLLPRDEFEPETGAAPGESPSSPHDCRSPERPTAAVRQATISLERLGDHRRCIGTCGHPPGERSAAARPWPRSRPRAQQAPAHAWQRKRGGARERQTRAPTPRRSLAEAPAMSVTGRFSCVTSDGPLG
jgi:hypothetical protein